MMNLDLIDVFPGRTLGGNPLAVVRGGHDLETSSMQRLTEWLGFSETTFLLPPTDSGADYRVRIFCSGRELPFAGHPTLGSARAWLEAGGIPARRDFVVQQCGVGLIDIRIDGGRLAFRAPDIRRSGPLTEAEREQAARFIGVNPQAIVDAVYADNGPGWQLLRLASAAAVLDARPAAEAPLGIAIGLVGPHPLAGPEAGRADWPESCSAEWEVRGFFTDAYGKMREDPVTGSLNAGIAMYLFGAGLAHGSYVAAQGSKIGADGRVYVCQDDKGDAWIGGEAVLIAQGAKLNLP